MATAHGATDHGHDHIGALVASGLNGQGADQTAVDILLALGGAVVALLVMGLQIDMPDRKSVV